jgi:hypothetical protein
VELFRDHRVGREWLPDDIIITRFADASFRVLADFDDDIDVTTATAIGATIATDGLAVWRERHLPLRKGSRRDGVAVLGWRAGEAPARFEITVPEGLRPAPGEALVFDLAELDEKPPKEKAKEKRDPRGSEEQGGEEETAPSDAAERPGNERGLISGGAAAAEPPAEGGEDREQTEQVRLLITVELVDAAGTAARIPLDRVRPVPPVLVSRFTKLPDESKRYGSKTEPVLQTFAVPLADFATAEPGFDASTVRVIRFLLGRQRDAVVVLDTVGFAAGW